MEVGMDIFVIILIAIYVKFKTRVMRKSLLYVFAVICTMGFFTACGDDDDSYLLAGEEGECEIRHDQTNVSELNGMWFRNLYGTLFLYGTQCAVGESLEYPFGFTDSCRFCGSIRCILADCVGYQKDLR